MHRALPSGTIVAALAVLSACSSQAPTPALQLPPPSSEALERPGTISTEQVSPPAWLLAICAGRAGCEVRERHDAGLSASGNARSVVEVWLGRPREGGAKLQDQGDCEQREAWLVHEGEGAPGPRLLVSMCNDGYGASGVGEDRLSVEGGLFTHSQLGGSAWRWSQSATVRLEPPGVARHHAAQWWVLSEHHVTERSFDFDDFVGRDRIEIPYCDEHGGLPDDGATIASFESTSIPSLALPEPIVTGPIADAARFDLSGCAARVTSSRGAADASLHAVFDEPSRSLLVQIADDHGSAGDRLYVWVSSERAGAVSHCHAPTEVRAVELDTAGRLVSGPPWARAWSVGSAPSDDGQRRLLRVQLDGLPESLSVAYRDADPGKPHVELGTSAAKHPATDLVTLGRRHGVEARFASCELDGRRVVVRLAPPPPPDRPLVGAP